jgi:aspartyl-tRNA synthetase
MSEEQKNYILINNQKQLLEITTESNITIKGRIHSIRDLKRNAFVVLRFKDLTIQCVVFKKNKINTDIPKESIVEIKGKYQKADPIIKSCSVTDYEIIVEEIQIISKSNPILPFFITDADNDTVTLETKLATPWLNFRTKEAKTVARVKSQTCQLFRNYLINNDFIEIHTPKIIGSKSEGGSEVFSIKYFDKDAYLAQSPQLYKQMAINGDYDKVFEIGSVFRAEPFTHNRHLCEFVTMDVEMTINEYQDVIDLACKLLYCMVNELNALNPNDANPVVNNIPIIAYPEAIKILRENNIQVDDLDDMSSAYEAILGTYVKTKYNEDIFVLNKYPTKIRPFYTKKSSDVGYANAFDIIFRGQEISSGAQRENNYETLIQQVTDKGIDPNSLKHYLESFSLGSDYHGGFAIGLDRFVSLYLGLNNVRKVTFLIRDPQTLEP